MAISPSKYSQHYLGQAKQHLVAAQADLQSAIDAIINVQNLHPADQAVLTRRKRIEYLIARINEDLVAISGLQQVLDQES